MNIIFQIQINNSFRSNLQGYGLSRYAWKAYAEKYGHKYICLETEIKGVRPQWTKAFIGDILKNSGIEYERICYVDSDTIPHKNCPDIFKECETGKFHVVRNYGSMDWVIRSIENYQKLFPDIELPFYQYFNSGLMVFDKGHDNFWKIVQDFYFNNQQLIFNAEQYHTGTDQPVINYIAQSSDIIVNYLDYQWNGQDLARFEILGCPDSYNYVSHFNAIPKEMGNPGNWMIKSYIDDYGINVNAILAYINEDKHTNPTTTSNKFKYDLFMWIQNNMSNANVIEFGTHKGQTSRVLSYVSNQVLTINKDRKSLETAINANQDISNITYLPFDLYSDSNFNFDTSVFNLAIIDAGHTYENVKSDIKRCLKMDNLQYIAFDDYGLGIHQNSVKRAIDEYIDFGKLEIVAEIGHKKDHKFSNNKVLIASEGVICKVIK